MVALGGVGVKAPLLLAAQQSRQEHRGNAESSETMHPSLWRRELDGVRGLGLYARAGREVPVVGLTQ